MCQPDPLREVLGRLSLDQVRSALGTAENRLLAARRDKDPASAEILTRVVSSISDELRDRLAVIVARGIVQESQDAERSARQLIDQMAGN